MSPFFQSFRACYVFTILTEQGGQHWQFRALPFSLEASLRIFMKVLSEVVSHLYLQGIALVPYFDDLLVYN